MVILADIVYPLLRSTNSIASIHRKKEAGYIQSVARKHAVLLVCKRDIGATLWLDVGCDLSRLSCERTHPASGNDIAGCRRHLGNIWSFRYTTGAVGSAKVASLPQALPTPLLLLKIDRNTTMKKISPKREVAEGLGLLALLLILLALFVAAYSSVTGGVAPRILAAEAPPTPVAQPQADEVLRTNPFPVTNTMTDTVSSVLAAYQQRSIGVADAGVPVPVQFTGSVVFLPQIVGPQASPDPTPSPTPRPEPKPDPADVAVAIWPDPSIRVARGGTLAYEIRTKNYGDGDAESIRVTLPYDKNKLSVVGSKLNGPKDWVSELKSDHVTVTLGPLKSGKSRTATLYFRVNGSLADNTVLSVRATYEWSDERHGSGGSTNWAPVLVGGGNDSAPWVWTVVDPVAGVAGTRHHFFSDRFIPGEGIVTWLNTPDGVKSLELRGEADPMGRIWLDFVSSGRRPGSYSLVLYGARSNLTGVATFEVR